MAVGFYDFRAVNQEDPWHAFDIAGGSTQEMTARPCGDETHDAARIEILMPFRAVESQLFIEKPFRVRKTRNILEMVRCKIFSGALFARQMDE